MVTGLTVADGVHVPKQFKKEVKRHLHFCKKYGPQAHLDRLGIDKDVLKFKAYLRGKIRYIYSTEPEVGKALRVEFEQVKWPL